MGNWNLLSAADPYFKEFVTCDIFMALTRYYDRYGFLGRDAQTASSAGVGLGRFGGRRGKVKCRARAPDALDYQAPVSSPSVSTITPARKRPIIVIPVTKARPILHSV